ncbi:MAG TPA: GNAT family N-acetyltransferase, partial [Armatimonadota bacterium]|nr:GNAT family N-acetyltransferase [Armatimonadota bacterium]
DAFQKSVRQKLRSARQRALTVRDEVAVAAVTAMFQRTMARQGMSGDPEVLAAWLRIAPAARACGCLFTTAVTDDEGHDHTARAMVWDTRCAYAIFGGSDPRFRQSGAAPYSLVHEMQVAADLVPAYDFEGSTIEPIEAFFRSFGGALTPYFLITRRASRALNAARALHGWSRRLRAASTSESPSLLTGAAA